jgi:poly [ADP-ribose] polymerase 10/14/15
VWGFGPFLSDYEVVKVERIQNSGLWCQYAQHKKSSSKARNEDALEIWCVHGNSPGALNNIAEGGFNRSFNGRNATSYGKGTYFAKTGNFAYSCQPQYATPDERGL